MKSKRKKSHFSLQLQSCFTAEELWQYHYGQPEPALRLAVQAHLSQDRCESCMEIFLTLPRQPMQTDMSDSLSSAGQRLLKKWEGETPAIRLEERPPTLTTGQIWSTKACLLMLDSRPEWNAPIGGPVMIIHSGDGSKQGIIRVLPLSTEIDYVRPPHSLTVSDPVFSPCPLLVEIFNERPMLAEHLDRYLGQVDNKDFEDICNARSTYQDMNTHTHSDETPADPDYDKWIQNEIRLAEHLSDPVMEKLASDISEDKVIWPFDTFSNPPGDQASTCPGLPPWMIPVFMIEPFQLCAQGTEAAGALPPEPRILLELPELQLGLVQKQDRIILRLVASDASSVRIQIDGAAVELLPTSGNVHETVIGFAPNMPENLKIILFYQDKKWGFQPKFTVKR